MMDKLVEKAGGRAPFPLVRATPPACRSRTGSLGGAYCRWVLHLIPNWRDAVAELCASCGPAAVIVTEPGGFGGGWRELWLRFVDVLGDRIRPVGLDWVGQYEDPRRRVRGGRRGPARPRRRSSPATTARSIGTSRRWTEPALQLDLAGAAGRSSAPAVAEVRAWAERTYPDLDAPFEPEVADPLARLRRRRVSRERGRALTPPRSRPRGRCAPAASVRSRASRPPRVTGASPRPRRRSDQLRLVVGVVVLRDRRRVGALGVRMPLVGHLAGEALVHGVALEALGRRRPLVRRPGAAPCPRSRPPAPPGGRGREGSATVRRPPGARGRRHPLLLLVRSGGSLHPSPTHAGRGPNGGGASGTCHPLS